MNRLNSRALTSPGRNDEHHLPRVGQCPTATQRVGCAHHAVRVRRAGRRGACHAGHLQAAGCAGRDRGRPIRLEPALLRAANNDAHVRGPRRVAAVHLHLRPARRQKPPPGAGDDPDPGHPAVGPDPGLPVIHHCLLHEPVPRPRRRAGVRRDFRDLHQSGLEHGVQLLPVADHHPQRPLGVHPQLPADRLAAVLAGWRCRSPCPAWCGT